MVKTALAIEREVDDTRSIQDMSTSATRNENQSPSSSKKKQKTSALTGPWPPGLRPRSIIQGWEVLLCS